MEAAKNSDSRTSSVPPGPWLLFVHDQGRSHTLFSLSEKRCYHSSDQEMQQRFQYWPTPQGWMLARDSSSRRYSLLNPITMATIELPPLARELPRTCRCFISSSPNDPDCTLLCFAPTCHYLFCCRLSDNKWMCQQYNLGNNDLTNVVSCEGKFYGHCLKNSVAIDFTPRPRIRMLNEIIWWPIDRNKVIAQYEVVSEGELYLVYRSEIRRGESRLAHVSVHRWSRERFTWVSTSSIGDRVFFIEDEDFIAACSASKVGIKGNCIYFVSKGEKGFCVYDLEEGTVETYVVCTNVVSSDSMAFWVVPPL